ncbi:MAG: DUF4412 domain-containing protein [Fibrobacteria bacterium]
MPRLLSAYILFFLCIRFASAAPAPAFPSPSAPSGTPKSAAAQTLKGFEGIIDMALILEAGAGDLRLYMAGERAKLDMSLQVAPLPSPIKLGVLLDSKTPKVVWIVNDNLKTYSYLNLEDSPLPLDTASAGKYVIKVLGKEKRLGYECTHLTLTRRHELVDAWITQDLPDVYAVLKKLQEANPQYGDLSIFQALEGAGKSGLPLKYIVVREGQRVTMEIRKIERKALPGALFTIPMDYKKTDGAGAAGLQPTPEQVEEMKKMIQGALQGQ